MLTSTAQHVVDQAMELQPYEKKQLIALLAVSMLNNISQADVIEDLKKLEEARHAQ